MCAAALSHQAQGSESLQGASLLTPNLKIKCYKSLKKNFPQLQIISQWFPSETRCRAPQMTSSPALFLALEAEESFFWMYFSLEMLLGMLEGFLWKSSLPSGLLSACPARLHPLRKEFMTPCRFMGAFHHIINLTHSTPNFQVSVPKTPRIQVLLDTSAAVF